MSRAVHIAFQDLKKSQAKVMEKDTQIADLELQLKNLQISKDSEVSGLQDQLKKEKNRAEKEAGELRSELTNLKEQLLQQSEEAIIAKFR